MLVWRFYMQGTQVMEGSGMPSAVSMRSKPPAGTAMAWLVLGVSVLPCVRQLLCLHSLCVSQRPCWSGIKRHGYRIRRANRHGVCIFCYFFRLDDSVRRIPMVKASNCWLYWQWLWDLFSARKFIKSVFFCNIYQTIPMTNLGFIPFFEQKAQ